MSLLNNASAAPWVRPAPATSAFRRSLFSSGTSLTFVFMHTILHSKSSTGLLGETGASTTCNWRSISNQKLDSWLDMQRGSEVRATFLNVGTPTAREPEGVNEDETFVHRRSQLHGCTWCVCRYRTGEDSSR